MKKLFRRDPLDIIDRRKQRAEKKYMRAKRKEWHRRRREEYFRNIVIKIRTFLAHPFAKRELTEEEREIMHIKRYRNRDRVIKRKKNWAKFKKNPLRFIFPSKKRRLPDGGYLYVYNMTRQEKRELAQLKRQQRIENFKTILSTPDLRQKFIFTYLHSTAYFIFSFMLIYIIYQIVTIGMASSFQIPVIWYYYELKFPLYTFSPLYTRKALVAIFAIGPIMSLMLSFLFLRLFFSKHQLLRRFQLFYLWGFINGANMFFGAYIAGFFTRTEFIYTSEWLFMSNVFDIEEIIFTVISFMVMVIIGRIVTPLFLLSSGSVTMIKPEFRFYFVFCHVVLPWITGVIIMILLTFPTYYIPLIIKMITPGLVLLPSLYLYDLLQYENIHRSGEINHNYFKWSIIIAAVALLFFYRIILSWGLSVT